MVLFKRFDKGGKLCTNHVKNAFIRKYIMTETVSHFEGQNTEILQEVIHVSVKLLNLLIVFP